MSTQTSSLTATESKQKKAANAAPNVFTRVAKYTIVRALLLFLAVVIAVFLVIIIANFGGRIDEYIKADIRLAIAFMMRDGLFQDLPEAERAEAADDLRLQMEEAAGLNEPFLLRSVRWLYNGLRMNWGEGLNYRLRIVDHLKRSLLLFGTSNLFLFFASISVALGLSRKHGGLLDKIVVGLSPVSSAPAWIFGILLNVFALRVLGVSIGGTFDAFPGEFKFSYLPLFLKHMSLPFLAIFISGFFQSLYAWRTFFMIYANEDHVEMATAKGLPPRIVERRYILRPALPSLLTSFALLMVSLWQEIIALEYFFNVQGLGRLLLGAIRQVDTPLIVSIVVMFAYLLVITIFLLDVLYSFVDPRVKVTNESQASRAVSIRRKLLEIWPLRLLAGGEDQSSQETQLERKSNVNLARKAERKPRLTLPSLEGLWRTIVFNGKHAVRQLIRYPSAVIGVTIIFILIGVSIYTPFAIPYDEAIVLWRGDVNRWIRNPKSAPPAWINLFRKNDLPGTIVMSTEAGDVQKQYEAVSDETTKVTITFPFDYSYEGYPQDIVVYLRSEYENKHPQLNFAWITPDGTEVNLTNIAPNTKTYAYYLDRDERLMRKLRTESPMETLLSSDPSNEEAVAQKGVHQLVVTGFMFEEDADIDAEFVLYGQVHGLFGTDGDRRDLKVALLWGTPIALSFGLLAAVGTSLSTMGIAAFGTWFGGWVDSLIQRITEVNMIIPFFPVSLMIYALYSNSFWAILGVTVLLSIFGAQLKTYRAIFLQVKEDPYVEAARAYGASNLRIIFRYLIPRIISVLIPQIVILVPSYVFLEATLAFLGVADPVLPTWGKLVVEGFSYGAWGEVYHLVLIPLSLLLLTGLAFAMVGFALERIFEPKVQTMK